jgi:hypothetical protein
VYTKAIIEIINAMIDAIVAAILVSNCNRAESIVSLMMKGLTINYTDSYYTANS